MADVALMKPARLRRLTLAEAALAEEMFGAALDPARVRLFALPVLKRAFVATGRLIAWPAAGALTDFGAAAVPLEVQAVFVHELTHVWQAQNGVNLLAAKLRAGDGETAYAYDLADGGVFGERNIEQQAMVVQHAFMARRGARTPYSAALYAAALREFRQA
jgi:hypothetical protein